MDPDTAPRDIDPASTPPGPTPPGQKDPEHTIPEPLYPGPLDYLAHLAEDSTRFVEVLREASHGARVPTCPDSDGDDLLWHLVEVQWFWAAMVDRGLTTTAQVEALVRVSRPGSRDEILAHFARASHDLQRSLSAASPQMPAWTWADDQSVGFIRRRQAHEALTHRIDAELTTGHRSPMDADLSADGVDEALHFVCAGAPSQGRHSSGPNQTVRVQTTDTRRSWLVIAGQARGMAVGGDTRHDGQPSLAVAVSDDGEAAAAAVSGTAADLDCWLWNRPPAGQIERAGDRLILERLDQAITTGVS